MLTERTGQPLWHSLWEGGEGLGYSHIKVKGMLIWKFKLNP